VALGRACLFPPLSSGGALVARPWLRFHTPLIEPDVRIARIRLSDKTSRLRPRHVVPKPAQTAAAVVLAMSLGLLAPKLLLDGLSERAKRVRP
jgi:hypothetical protein